MIDHLKKIAAMLLLSGLVSTTALPVIAQQKPQDLMQHIKGEPLPDYILTRCAGYFKAMMMTNANAEQRLKNRAEATMRWMFEQIFAIRGPAAVGNLDEVGQGIADDIETHAQFYLDRMVTNIADTGQPFDDLIAVDQKVCLVMASQRPEGE